MGEREGGQGRVFREQERMGVILTSLMRRSRDRDTMAGRRGNFYSRNTIIIEKDGKLRNKAVAGQWIWIVFSCIICKRRSGQGKKNKKMGAYFTVGSKCESREFNAGMYELTMGVNERGLEGGKAGCS